MKMYDDLRFWAFLLLASVALGLVIPGMLYSAPPSDERLPQPVVEAVPPQTQEPPAPVEPEPVVEPAPVPAPTPADEPAPVEPAKTDVPWNQKCADEAAYWPNVYQPIWGSFECQDWYKAMGVDGKGPIQKPE